MKTYRNTRIKALAKAVLPLYLFALIPLLNACSDTWDEHYDGAVAGVQEGSLWEAIKRDANLSNFASVIEACGYDKALGSSQVFTVFAPDNGQFSSDEAAQLIQEYNKEKTQVNDDDNSVIKEFVKNHIALFNYSVSENSADSIVLMNGKRVVLTSNAVGATSIVSGNVHYENGILFVLDGTIAYEPNVFEYLRKDAELDSVASFFYNSHFYRKEFLASKSVPGGLVDGKTVYLDSVFQQENELFYGQFFSARLDQEDSTYWMVVPTNDMWTKLIDEYTPYFNYDNKVLDRDSLVYTQPRVAIMNGAIFSRTLNTDNALRDSAFSTLATEGTYREYFWGAPCLHYYQFGDGTGNSTQKPLQTGGVLADTKNVDCSNGIVMKADKWNFDPLNTFRQVIVVQAVSRGSIQEVSKVENSTTHDMEATVTPTPRVISSDNPFYGKIWGNAFEEFVPAKATVNHTVTFNIRNVLSNMGYDIYLVSAPALANDSNATEIDRLPTKLRCTLTYHLQKGGEESTVLQSSVSTTPDVVDYLLLAEDFKFPTSSYGLIEDKPQVTLAVETRVSPTELRKNTYTRTMRIAYVLLVPHGISHVDEENFYITPHGDGETFVMPIM